MNNPIQAQVLYFLSSIYPVSQPCSTLQCTVLLCGAVVKEYFLKNSTYIPSMMRTLQKLSHISSAVEEDRFHK